MVYADNAATTKMSRTAIDAMLPYMETHYGNPSSLYRLGQEAAEALQSARETVAACLGCTPRKITFTSGGSEADNQALISAARIGERKGKKHIITTAVEHSAVLEPCKALEMQGYEVTYLHPDATGHIRIEALEEALRPDTVLVSMMLVNNELGCVLPVKEAAALVKAYDKQILFHTDAVQGFLKVPFTPAGLGVDLLSLSGHKIHAPKGIGALYIRQGLPLKPFILGGGQENGLRSGTEPTGQIAAFAVACQTGKAKMAQSLAHMNQLKAYTLERLHAEVPQVEAAARLGAPMIELHTGCFANHSGRERTEELARLKRAAELAHSLGIQVNAGHGINYQNLEQLLAGVPCLHELNIGHTIVSRALFVGMEQAVREMRQAIDRLS